MLSGPSRSVFATSNLYARLPFDLIVGTSASASGEFQRYGPALEGAGFLSGAKRRARTLRTELSSPGGTPFPATGSNGRQRAHAASAGTQRRYAPAATSCREVARRTDFTPESLEDTHGWVPQLVRYNHEEPRFSHHAVMTPTMPGQL